MLDGEKLEKYLFITIMSGKILTCLLGSNDLELNI